MYTYLVIEPKIIFFIKHLERSTCIIIGAWLEKWNVKSTCRKKKKLKEIECALLYIVKKKSYPKDK